MKRDRKTTLKKSILLWTIPFILLICIVMSALQFFSTKKILYTRYESYIRNVLNYVASDIDTDDLAECIKTGVESDKYRELQLKLDNCRDRLDIHFIYIIEPLNTEPQNNIRNVIAGVSQYEYENQRDELVYLNMPTGDSYSPETAAKYLDAYNSGKLSFFEEVSEWGDDYTGLLPLYDSHGNKIAALCIDVDIAQIHTLLRNEVLTDLSLILLIGTVFIIVFLVWIMRNVTKPIEQLEGSVTELALKCKDQKDPDALRIDVPEIHTNNEVEALAHAVRQMSEAMQGYVKGMVTAENAARAAQKIEIKQQRLAERLSEERIAYTRINALVGDFICIYVIVPETGRYREYSATDGFESYALPKEGADFFSAAREHGRKLVYPADLNRYLSVFTKENVLNDIKNNGMFAITYRIIINDKLTYVQLRAAMVEEKDGNRLIVGLNDIDTSVRQEQEYEKCLAQAQRNAHIDALTGVKNKHSYLDSEARLDRLITLHRAPEFAIVMLDLNDLKLINDLYGHQAGDQHIKDAYQIICNTFKHSPVFRIGGDEFAVIADGSDYDCIEELIGRIRDHNISALNNKGPIIACGMARFEDDACVAAVFERADQKMYENKNDLKANKNVQ